VIDGAADGCFSFSSSVNSFFMHSTWADPGLKNDGNQLLSLFLLGLGFISQFLRLHHPIRPSNTVRVVHTLVSSTWSLTVDGGSIDEFLSSCFFFFFFQLKLKSTRSSQSQVSHEPAETQPTSPPVSHSQLERS
jgi:hypothetical protein